MRRLDLKQKRLRPSAFFADKATLLAEGHDSFLKAHEVEGQESGAPEQHRNDQPWMLWRMDALQRGIANIEGKLNNLPEVVEESFEN
eukprot:5355936-Prorocentrum_lima.AAC.1